MRRQNIFENTNEYLLLPHCQQRGVLTITYYVTSTYKLLLIRKDVSLSIDSVQYFLLLLILVLFNFFAKNNKRTNCYLVLKYVFLTLN